MSYKWLNGYNLKFYSISEMCQITGKVLSIFTGLFYCIPRIEPWNNELTLNRTVLI